MSFRRSWSRLHNVLGAWLFALLIAFSVFNADVDAGTGWVRPTSFIDIEGKWTQEARAYDNNTNTWANDTSNRSGYGAVLELVLPAAINCGRVRMFADFGPPAVDRVRVQVHRDGSWVQVHDGAIDNLRYSEITFTEGQVDRARFEFHYTRNGYIYWLYEFHFFESPVVVVPPTGTTLDATSVEESSGILHGRLDNDGGEPCEYQFEYGLDTSYGNSTGWLGSHVTGDTFGRVITGLINGRTYHYRVQVRNSAGTFTGGDKTFFTSPPASGGWVSPTGHQDPGNLWLNESLVYDDELASLSSAFHNINDPEWSPYLILTHPPIPCDAVRFYAKRDSIIDQVNVDVYRDGGWVDVYQGGFNNKQWVELAFTQGTVSQSRISFRVNDRGNGLNWELYEFDFRRVSSGDLSIAKTASPSTVLVGDDLTYTITVTNNGPGNVTGVAVTDGLPSGLTFKAAGSSPGWTETPPGSGTWTNTIGNMANGASQILTLVAVPGSSAVGTITNTVSVAANEGDPNTGNNLTSAVSTVDPAADLVITKSESDDPALAGTTLTYTLDVTNVAGRSDATGVVVSESLPSGTTFNAGASSAGWAETPPSSGNYQLTIGDLASGGASSVQFAVDLPSSMSHGSSISNTASVALNESDPVAGNNSATENTTINREADLGATKSADPDPVLPGQDLTYTVTITNLGPSDATNVTFNDPLPANLTFVSSADGCTEAGGVVSCPTFDLAAGATQTLTFVGNVAPSTPSGTDLVNVATVSLTETDPDGSNDQGSATTPVNLPPSATDDTGTTDEDTSVVIDLITNDSDPDRDPLSVANAFGMQKGTVVLNGDGTITYSPLPDENGVDVFSYTVDDGRNGTDVGTVTVTINPVNDTPTASDLSVTTDEDVALHIQLPGDDGDPELQQGMFYEILTSPTHGQITGFDSGTGVVTYLSNPDWFGVDQFSYRVTDDGSAGPVANVVSNVAQVTITVNPVNDPPLINSPIQTGPDFGAASGGVEPTPFPNLVMYYQLVTFSLAVADKEGEPLTTTWDFGDGATASGDQVTHLFTAAGVYTVTAIVSDGTDVSTTTLTVTVADRMGVLRMRARANFARPNSDMVVAKGGFHLPPHYDFTGVRAAFDIGGTRFSFTLDERGRGSSKDGRVRFKLNRRKQAVKFQLRVRGGTWYPNWADEGCVDADIKSTQVFMRVIISLNDQPLMTVVPAFYTAKKGRNGTLKR